MRRRLISLVVAMIIGLGTFYLVPPPLPELSRAAFMAEVRAGHVRSVEIADQEIITGISSTLGAFRSDFHRDLDAALPAELRALGVEVTFRRSVLGLI